MRTSHLSTILGLLVLFGLAFPAAAAQGNSTDGGEAEVDLDPPEESRDDGGADGLSATTVVVLVVLAVLVIGLIVAVASRR